MFFILFVSCVWYIKIWLYRVADFSSRRNRKRERERKKGNRSRYSIMFVVYNVYKRRGSVIGECDYRPVKCQWSYNFSRYTLIMQECLSRRRFTTCVSLWEPNVLIAKGLLVFNGNITGCCLFHLCSLSSIIDILIFSN